MSESFASSKEISFNKVMEIFHDKLDEMLGDPLLCDLPQEATLDEIKSLIALEHGQAMTVKVRRADGEIYPIIVSQTATVSDLQKGIKRYVQLKQERDGENTCISWKYLWKAFLLVFQGEKLRDSTKMLKEYGIHNRDEVNFVKRLSE